MSKLIFIDPSKSYEDNCEHSVKINEIFKKLEEIENGYKSETLDTI